MLTRASVHWAERMVAARSSKSFEWSSSHRSRAVPGYSSVSSSRVRRARPAGVRGRAMAGRLRGGSPDPGGSVGRCLPPPTSSPAGASGARRGARGRAALRPPGRPHRGGGDRAGRPPARAGRGEHRPRPDRSGGPTRPRRHHDLARRRPPGGPARPAPRGGGRGRGPDPPSRPAPAPPTAPRSRRPPRPGPGGAPHPAVRGPPARARRRSPAWIRANNRAFADHPDQGAETEATLDARLAEPWFDPAGFLLVDDPDRPGELAGSCWTKVHPATADEPALGEIYIIGVDPSQQGSGLGAALVLAGLDHLAARGLATALLFVEADNRPALALYDRLGFAPHGRRRVYEP